MEILSNKLLATAFEASLALPGVDHFAIKSDEKGEVISATAAVSKNIAKDSNKATIFSNVIQQIKEAAGTDVAVTMTVKDADGKTKYKLKVDTADLKAGNNLYTY